MRTTVTKAAQEELRAIYAKNGYINEKLVVAASKKKRSALHPYFHWDNDTEAARIGRLEIARSIIIKVHIVEHPMPTSDITVSFKEREFHGVGDGYRSLSDVLDSEDLTNIALDNALRSLEQFRLKYGYLAALSGVVKAANKAAASRKRAKRKAKK